MRTLPPIHSTEPTDKPALSYTHLLLTVQTVVIILLSINRLSTLTIGYVAANEFLRWVDLNNMLFLPLISLIAFYLLKQHLAYASPVREGYWHRALGLIFVVGVYLMGASYGDHEVTNYLHGRFCATDESSALCRIVIFNDDEFSHWVFFTAFVVVNVVLMLMQVLFPHRQRLTKRDLLLLVVNGLFIGLGVFANLAFEEIGLDLYVVAIVALVAVGLLWRQRQQPLLIYYSVAYVFGLVATGLVKALGS
jgi:hypothetical protein